MFELKQLLVLALAVTTLACQCRQDARWNGKLDIKATEEACRLEHGVIHNPGTDQVDSIRLGYQGLANILTTEPPLNNLAPLDPLRPPAKNKNDDCVVSLAQGGEGKDLSRNSTLADTNPAR
ncbi:hypothetical protein EG328_000355 [Venturia inaequalis]|uniref:Uncharacterized protein n=2 Tax=Venturia inaequalis TaxID=5025 RepID=A0A8H3UZP1_VENIN|nr:hypothetical protein EG328_000355 [Venturia inaequalis]